MSRPANTAIDLSLLPALPGVAREILTQFNDEFVTGEDVAAIVQKDPGITARLVSLANSAYFGLPQAVTDMEQIVVRVLGVDNVRALALALATANVFDTASSRFRLADFWLRAFLAGEACRRAANLMESCSDEVRALSYTSGFCCDIGWIALSSVAPEQTDQVLSTVEGDYSLVQDQCNRLFEECLGMTPPEATAILAQQWGMPEAICAAYDARSGTGDSCQPLTEALQIADWAIGGLSGDDAVQATESNKSLESLVESAMPSPAYRKKAAALVASLAVA